MIEPINQFSWPNTVSVPDGWYMTEVPSVTQENLEYLAERFNELAEAINKLNDC